MTAQNNNPAPPSSGETFPIIQLEDEMKKSYLDYAMSVIVSRALPDARDGLKPVHRRILYAMKDGGYDSTKAYKKSARIVGDVMGKYHPHGDSAIYDAMVRMAQDFSMSLPLVDGQGNFGSMDGDPAAAMRYTEARLAKSGEAILQDYDKDTVDFRPNYDESISEPTVLPSRVPNLLVNGAGGIAVGMATNIPPHNLSEVIDGCIAYVDNNDIAIEDLMAIIPGPDFPTGGQILGRTGIRLAYTTGNGSVMMRAKTTIEEIRKDREAIIVHEVPYQVNKSKLLERIGELVRDKIVEGIADLRDESDRDGVRVVIELKRDAQGEVVLNQLYKHTPLQTSFACNMLALNMGRPQTFNLKQFIEAFVKFREEVITRRTIYELGKARERGHVLAGLAVAVANIDEVIQIIRNAKDPAIAREELMARDWPAHDVAPLIALIDDPEYPVTERGTYKMSEVQVRAILDLRLHRLTGLERDKIGGELSEVTDQIREFLEILGSREKMLTLLKNELVEVKTQFGVPRRTELVENFDEADIEDLIAREDMVVTVSNAGYCKRVPLSTYRAQKRGGKGRIGATTKEDDFVTDMFVASTHTPILFFTSRGIVHRMKVWQLPLANAQSRGKALINMMPLEQGENVSVYLRMPENPELIEQLDLMFATSHGTVRRNKLTDFANIRSNGLIAMKLEDGEKLVSVKICRSDENILLATRDGKAIRFEVEDIRVFAGRTSTGVRGIKLADGDEVISMSVLKSVEATPEERAAYIKRANALRGAEGGDEPEDNTGGDVTISEDKFKTMQAGEQFLLCVTDKGFGKRTSAYDYRVTGRGGSGITNMNLTAKNGKMVATFPVSNDQQIMLVTDGGQMIRTPVTDIRFTGRATQGVRVFNVDGDSKVVSVAWLTQDEAEDGEEPTMEAASDAVVPAEAAPEA